VPLDAWRQLPVDPDLGEEASRPARGCGSAATIEAPRRHRLRSSSRPPGLPFRVGERRFESRAAPARFNRRAIAAGEVAVGDLVIPA
jgi:hypothetical protein